MRTIAKNAIMQKAMSPTNTRGARKAEAMLLLATFFWGWTFPVVKDALAVMPVFAFLALRFFLAAALMLPLAWRAGRGGGARPLLAGLYLGVLLFFAFALQTLGLEQTSAAKCAFITGLNVVWVALWAARGARAWLGVACGMAGLFFITNPQGDGINFGDWLTLGCSLFIALHLLALAKTPHNSAWLAFLQFAVVAALCAAAALARGEALLPPTANASLLFALALTVLGATIFSFWAQTHFQRRTTPTRAAIIFIMEPVFAAAFAVLFYGESLPAGAWAGGALIVAAMAIIATTPPPAAAGRKAAGG